MRSRSFARFAVVLSLTTTLLPLASDAGPYINSAAAMRAVVAGVKLTRGDALVVFAAVQGGSVYGRMNLLQIPGQHGAQMHFGIADVEALNEVNEVVADEGVAFVGCIIMHYRGDVVDQGCDVKPASTITLDPAMQTWFVTFSVGSSIEGRLITATLKFEGTGNPQPIATNPEAEVKPFPPPGAQKPDQVIFNDAVGLIRAAEVTSGSVRSDIFVGGSVTETYAATMLSAAGTSIDIDFLKMLCLASTRPDQDETCFD